MSSARRTNDSPTYATSCVAVHSRSARSFSVSASTLSAPPGTLIPWCERIWPGSVTFSRARPRLARDHVHRHRAVGEQHASGPPPGRRAGRGRCRSGDADRRRVRARPPGRTPRRGRTTTTSPGICPSRILGPHRSCSTASWIPDLLRDPPDRLELRPCAPSCVPCEKLSRKTSTPASTIWPRTAGSLDAGPTVATILVRTFPNCSLWNGFIESASSVPSG